MRTIAEFTKTTLVGGLLVVLPIYLTILLLIKMIAAVLALFGPVTAQIPAAVHFRQLVAIVAFVIVCFVAGIAVRTGPGRWAKLQLDRRLLERVPGYTFLRSLTGRVVGAADDSTFAVALVEIEEALVPAFVVETHDDGSFTILVPSVPTPLAGSIYILPPQRVHLVDVPFARAASVISRWGQGAKELRAAMAPRPAA